MRREPAMNGKIREINEFQAPRFPTKTRSLLGERTRQFALIAGRLCTRLNADLESRSASPIRLRISVVSVMSSTELAAKSEPGGAMYAVDCGMQDRLWLIGLSSVAINILVDRAFGGRCAAAGREMPARPLTAIDLRVGADFARTLSDYTLAAASIVPSTRVMSVASLSTMATLSSENAILVQEVTVDNGSSTGCLSLICNLAAAVWICAGECPSGGSEDANPRPQSVVAGTLQLKVDALIRGPQATLGECLEWKSGDLLRLEQGSTGVVLMAPGDTILGHAELGRTGKRFSVRIANEPRPPVESSGTIPARPQVEIST
jgi:flagellar motor switch protein FliM